ncbi:hypothetical protein BJ912DRAFT_1022504 [Pholiota molesta]|nr:hypothetical protein BJ912DRAFT_1022504 [Pholiota molesta]
MGLSLLFSSAYTPGTRRKAVFAESYPTFLSVQDSVVLQLTWAWRGLYDAFRWNVVFGSISSDAEIRPTYTNLSYSIRFFAFDLCFRFIASATREGPAAVVPSNIGWFYQILWLLPVVGISFYLNRTWCTVIANRTYLLQHGGRPAPPPSASYTGMLKSIATFIWVARNMSIAGRVRHLEERWAYYFAFGLPSAALFFALVFLWPVPTDPYNPMPLISQRAQENDTIRHPSPFVPIRLPIFAIVIWLNDAIVRILNVIGGRPIVRHQAAAQMRRFSDASENAEDGVNSPRMEMQPLKNKQSSASSSAKR